MSATKECTLAPGDPHPNLKLLSHSSRVLLHKCPRKYQLYKLLETSREDTIDTAFGNAVGTGIQEYMHSGSLPKAYMAAFLIWRLDLLEEDQKGKKKTFWHALVAIDKFAAEWDFGSLHEYQLVYTQGPSGPKPAIELGFQIDFGGGFTDRGFLDALLQHKYTKEFVVYEGKTSAAFASSEAEYKNSAQHVGYSVVVDAVVAQLGLPEVTSSYKVLTNIYKSKNTEWELLEFTKTYVSRALWIRSILLDIKHILEYTEEDYFPMHGESCNDFFRPCQFFGICEMSNRVLLGGKEVTEIVVKQDRPEDYQYHFTVDQLIEAQLEKGMRDEH